MKIWNKLKKILLYFGICVVLLIIGLYVYADKTDINYPDYSTYNSKQTGLKALYLLTEISGFNTSRFETSARFLPDGIDLIAVQPDLTRFSDDLEKKYLKEWIERGNVLIFISNKDILIKSGLKDFTGTNPIAKDLGKNITLYSVKNSKIFIIDNPEDLTNEGLRGKNSGIDFITALDGTGIKQVYFDEYYHGMGKEGVPIWRLLGQTGILIAIQLSLGLIILLFYLSRRFGKPATVFEIIKRKENENLFALSNIYIKAKANNLVFENYLKGFKIQLSKYLGFVSIPEDTELIEAASTSYGLKRMDITNLFGECKSFEENKKISKKQLFKIVKRIEEVRKELN